MLYCEILATVGPLSSAQLTQIYMWQQQLFHRNSLHKEKGVSGFSGMGIVEWWNGGMVEWMHVLFFGACWQ